MPTVGGLDKAFYWADLWDCEAVQIYLTLSRTWKVNKLNDKEILNFKNGWRNSGVKEVVSHIPYLVNLASDKEEIRKKSIDRLIAEIERAEILEVKYIVLHPGSYGKATKEEGIKKIIDGLQLCLGKFKNIRSKILLETMAGQGTSIGSSFSDLKFIINNISCFQLDVCLDTSHIFAAGYDIRDEKSYKKTLKEFDTVIGIDKIKVIHFNDSKTELGSKIDRHEDVGKGKIGMDAFSFFVNDERFREIPKILETPNLELENNAKDMIKALNFLITKDGKK